MTTAKKKKRKPEAKWTQHVRIGSDMTWPGFDDNPEGDSLEWTLRYGDPTRGQILSAASYVAAYQVLVMSTQKHRNYICSELRRIALRRKPKKRGMKT